jgi:hypothetical protein
MFETVHIARSHLMRYQYPELESAVEASTSWSATLAGSLAGWFGSPPESESEGDVAEDDDWLLNYCWPVHPY